MLPEHDVNSAEQAFQESNIIMRHAEKARLINPIWRPSATTYALAVNVKYIMLSRIGMARPLPAHSPPPSQAT
jgi:hypothetical protein